MRRWQTMAEGPGHKVAPLPRAEDKSARPGTRLEYESVDFEVIEELSGIDIEFEDASVQKILAMTGANWSLDEQRETLKEAAKGRQGEGSENAAADGPNPALHIPTPYDF